MYIVFFSTSHVFEAEERLNEHGIECSIVPTPVTDKAYCGVCVETQNAEAEQYVSELEHDLIQ